MKNTVYILLAALLFAGCEKSLDLNYNTTDPMLVIEGHATEGLAKARLTYTKNVDDNNPYTVEPNAVVKVTGSDGVSANLPYDKDGWYVATGFPAVPGVTYTFEATVDGTAYTAVSTMPAQVPIAAVDFEFIKIVSEEYLYCKVDFDDAPGVDNYYYAMMYVDDKWYEWDIASDMNQDGKRIQISLDCNKDDGMWGTTPKEALERGNRVKIELRHTDKFTFDYLTAKRLANPRPVNPPVGYSPACLGYFSAYCRDTYEVIYDGEPGNSSE